MDGGQTGTVPCMRARGARATLVPVLLALAAIALPTSAHAQAPPRQTAAVLFSQLKPASSTGLRIIINYRNPNDPSAKPFAVQRIVTALAAGSQIDTSAPAVCKLSDAELMANGARDCPAASVVGSGVITLSSVNADASTTAAVTLINNAGELIFVVEPQPAGAARMVLRSPIRGATITNEVPRLPGGPPDGATAIRTVDLRIGAVSRRDGSRVRNYITTPPACPAPNRFDNSAAFTYFDGVSQTVAAPSPCIVDTAPPRVRVTGISRRCVRHNLHARVRVTDTSGLRGAVVRLNGRRVKSTKRKRFAVKVRRARLRKGRNRLTVVAVDRRGNRVTYTRRFRRCS